VKHPISHIDEEVRVGPAAYDRRMIGRMCTIVLESTLRKVWERAAAGSTALGSPRREAR